MKEQIFRKSSIERVNSPEQLNEYIRVAGPSVWLVLSAIVILLAGVCIWGIFGKMETKAVIPVMVKDGIATGYFPAERTERVEMGMEAVIGDIAGTVSSVSDMPVQMGNDVDPYVFYLGGFSEGDFCYQTMISAEGLADGIYEAKIILDSIPPIRFVIR